MRLLDFMLIIPEFFLLFGIFAILFFGVIYCLSAHVNFPFLYKNVIYLSIILLICTFFLVLNSLDLTSSSVIFLLSKSDYGNFTAILILGISICVFIGSYFYNVYSKLQSFEYSIIILLTVLSLLLIVQTNNIFSFYLLLEFQSICLYVLAAYSSRENDSIEAGLKYFILGSFSSSFFLFGLVLLYGFTGLTFFEDLHFFFLTYLPSEYILICIESAIMLLTLGLLFKIYCVPFHFWVVDIYDGSPYSTTIFIACVPTLAMLYVFVKLYVTVFFEFIYIWEILLFGASCFTMLFGALGGIFQSKIKKIIAYSSITNVGYFLMCLVNSDFFSVHTGLLYFFIYIINLLGIFYIFSHIYNISGNISIDSINLLCGFSKQNRFAAFSLSCLLFPSAGMPPFNPFFLKLFMFTNVINSSSYILIFIGLFCSILSCYFYIKIIKYMYYNIKNIWFTYLPMPYYACVFIILFIFFQLDEIFLPSVFDIFFSIMALDIYIYV
jgi:NADH-quinone oxidoreductase subunit N